MRPATLFPDDDIHDTADEWKDDAAPVDDSKPRIPKRRARAADDKHGTTKPTPAIHRMLPTPKVYDNGTLTSRTAAESARVFVNSQAARVHAFIESQGERGATDKEIQAGLKMAGDSQRPRRVWLRDRGFIKLKGEPSETVVRDRCAVWVVARPLELPQSLKNRKDNPNNERNNADA